MQHWKPIHVKWSGTIRVRKGAYRALDQYFKGTKRSHGLPCSYGTRAMRLYNVSAVTLGNAIADLAARKEPFDAHRPQADGPKSFIYATGRADKYGDYTWHNFLTGKPLGRHSWVNQTLFWKRAQTRRLLKPED